MRGSAQVIAVAVAGLSTLTLAACATGSSGSTDSVPSTASALGLATGSTSGTTAASTTESGTLLAPTPSATPSATSSRSPTTAASAVPALGVGASLHGRRPFPSSDPWNTAVDKAAVDPNSATLIASIGRSAHLHPDFGANYDGGPFGIPYVVVGGTQKRVPVGFEYADESDPGPYPIPANAPVEGGASSTGDRHVLVVDRDHWKLYELYAAKAKAKGSGWSAGSGAVFNLSTGKLRPAGWTSADAAGLPIFPGLVRYDEVSAGLIKHALRFTVSRSRHAYVAPARHFASSDTSAALPPMGMRVRLKAGFVISGYPKPARVILQAMKTYGMIVADNGSDWYVSGAPDKRWDDEALNTLKQVPGSAFEVIRMPKPTTH